MSDIVSRPLPSPPPAQPLAPARPRGVGRRASQVRYNQKNGGHLKNGTELSASPRLAAARAPPRDPAAPRARRRPRRRGVRDCSRGRSQFAAARDGRPRHADARRRLVLPASGGAHDGVAAPARPLRRRRARRREEPGQPAGRVVLVRQPNGDLLARPAESPEELPPPPTGARRLVRRFHRLSLPRSRVLLAARGPEEPRPRASTADWSLPVERPDLARNVELVAI